MDEEKKSEASAEEPERLGPYVLQEQVEQDHDSPVELYLATHETSGATALVRKHGAEEGTAPGKDWRVRLGSSSEGYSALEVEHTDWAKAQDSQSAESLLLTSQSVLEEARRMTRVLSDTQEPRHRWRLWGMVSAAAVCVLFFALGRLTSESQPPSAPSAPLSHEVLTAGEESDLASSGWLLDTSDAGESVARPLPKGPFKGQKRPPCIRYTEVELVGGCWMTHELKAPCPDELYEYQGKCYAPTFSAKPPPSSLGN